MDDLTREEILKISELSYLELTDEEISKLQKELSDIIRYFNGQLATVLSRPNAGGTLRVLTNTGHTVWFVASQCEVISASR